MKLPPSILVLVTALLTSACEGESEVKTLEIAHYRSSCMGLSPALCYLANGELFHDTIEGWHFEWGHQYRLEVQTQQVTNPPADGSGIAYSLRRVISDEAVPAGTTFSVPIFSSDLLSSSGDAYSLHGERAIDCGVNGLCGSLVTAMQTSRPCLELVLAHPAGESDPLVMKSLAPYSAGFGCQK